MKATQALLHEAVADGRELACEEASEPAADIGLRHLEQLKSVDGIEQNARLVVKSFAFGVCRAGVVATSGAMVQNGDFVRERNTRRLIVGKVDKEIADVETAACEISVVVVVGRVVEEMREFVLYEGYAGTAARDDVGALPVEPDESFAKLFGGFAVALLVEVHTAAGQVVRIVAVDAQFLQQVHHLYTCRCIELVDATRDENPHLIVVIVHFIRINGSAKILHFHGI